MLSAQVVVHHLKLFGLARALTPADGGTPAIVVMAAPGNDQAEAAKRTAEKGAAVVALAAHAQFCGAFAMDARDIDKTAFRFESAPDRPWARLWTLHRASAYSGGEAVVTTDEGDAVWSWKPVGRGGVLFIGTDLAADLIRFRQGDPREADLRPSDALWGIAGERPVYLYDRQLQGHADDERSADNWCMSLVYWLAARTEFQPAPMLPGGAPGAVVITGDDDQAYLEKYQHQLDVLDGLPITYFLHPLTRHTPETLKTMLGRPGIEVELHPDALDAPAEYAAKLDEQTRWFRELTGRDAHLVRNHGFLNDGYWGHLGPWRDRAIWGTSNLPGLYGRVLNGSLLPARMAVDGQMTEHWSVLTAVGDGVRFMNDFTDEQAAETVRQVARRIVDSGIPGVLVLNLHPQNIAETLGMHLAVKELVAQGWQAWNLGQCLDWFAARDGLTLGQTEAAPPLTPSLWMRILKAPLTLLRSRAA